MKKSCFHLDYSRREALFAAAAGPRSSASSLQTLPFDCEWPRCDNSDSVLAVSSSLPLVSKLHNVGVAARRSSTTRVAFASVGLPFTIRYRASSLYGIVLYIQKFQVRTGSSISFFHSSITRTRAKRYPAHWCSSHRYQPSSMPSSHHHSSAA